MGSMKNGFNMGKRGAALLIITGIILLLGTVPVQGAGLEFTFNDDASIETSLPQFKGKSVDITLKSGEQVSGKVSNIGSHVMLLKELKGKEYYDALINIDEIAAVTYRAR